MTDIILSRLDVIESAFTRYALPPEGISLLGYLVRCMHRTQILTKVSEFTAQKLYPHALAQVAHYAAASSASFGQSSYEPLHDKVGASVMERDPQTKAIVMAKLEGVTPHNRFSYLAKLPNEDHFDGLKYEEESRFTLHGWETPTTVCASFTSADESYHTEMQGSIIHERVPRIVGSSILRASGELEVCDNQGNHGTVTLHRNATAVVEIKNSSNRLVLKRELTIS